MYEWPSGTGFGGNYWLDWLKSRCRQFQIILLELKEKLVKINNLHFTTQA